MLIIAKRKEWKLTELTNDGHFDKEPIERSMLRLNVVAGAEPP